VFSLHIASIPAGTEFFKPVILPLCVESRRDAAPTEVLNRGEAPLLQKRHLQHQRRSAVPKKSPGQVAGAFLQFEAVKTDSLCDDA
jgi:hypothetical protein